MWLNLLGESINLFDEKNKAIKLLNNTATLHSSPKKQFIILSKYYKNIGLSKERTSDLLLDWLKKQKCTLNFNDVIHDMEKAVDNVYKKNYIYIHDIKANFYRNEIETIKALKSKGDQKIGLSLLYLSKIFGEEFYCYHSTLHKLTKISIRHIKRIIKRLEQQGIITVLSRNETKKVILDNNKMPLKRYSYPNTYKINIIPDGDILFTAGDISTIDEIYEMII